MATTIYVTTGLKTVTGGLPNYQDPSGTDAIAMAGSHVSVGTMNTSTTAAQIPIAGGIVTAGYAQFLNTDPTNAIEIGLYISGTFYPFALLNPGDAPAQLRLSGLTYYAQAVAGTPILQFGVLEA
jgi:hypothetical protein